MEILQKLLAGAIFGVLGYGISKVFKQEKEFREKYLNKANQEKNKTAK